MSPELYDIIKEAISAGLHVSLPAKIESFDAASQTCTCQPLIKDVNPMGEYIPFPVLVGLPVQFPGGSKFAITFHLEPGDEGMVVFSDRDTGAWLDRGEIINPDTPRQHHLADGVFVPGIRSSPKKLSEFKSNALVIGQQSDVGVRITSGKVELGVKHSETAGQSAVLGDTQKQAFDTYINTVNAAGMVLTAIPAATDPVTVITLANGLKVFATALDSASSTLKSSLANTLSTKVKIVTNI